MKKRKTGILTLLLIAIMCFSVGIVGCGKTDARIVIQTDATELVFARGDGYTTPIAGVFDSNLDRIDGVQVAVKAYNAKGDLVEESEPSEQVYLSFYSLGKWKIEYVAYRDGKKASDIPTKSITAYVCSRLTAPKNFTVDGDTLTWSAINNASSYEVTVNGGDPVEVNGTSFTSEIFSKVGFYVGVTAKGDNRNYVDSNMATYRNRTPLADGVLMAFDDPNYELDVRTAVDSKITLAPDEIEWLSEEEVAGSTGGALKLRVRSGNYGWGVFKILLPEMIKLDTNDTSWSGMEVRFKVDSKTWRDDTWFFVNQPAGYGNKAEFGMHITEAQNDQWHVLQLDKSTLIGKSNQYYSKYTTKICSTMSLDGTVVSWTKSGNEYGYQIEVTKTGPDTDADEDLLPDETKKTYTMYSINEGYSIDENTSFTYDITTDEEFYQAGDDYSYTVKVLCEIPTNHDSMNFNLYDLVRTTGRGNVYLDYVRLYSNALSAPQNFRYEDGKILWDVVDGAARYTLNIVKTVEGVEKYSQYYVDGGVGEFDIATAGLTAEDVFRAEIMAMPADATYCSSEYSKFSAIGTPTNLETDDNGILTWTAVDNARAYVINVNGTEIISLNNSLDISSYLNKGDVTAKVKALAKPGYLDGDYSAVWAKISVEGKTIAAFDSELYQQIVKLGAENTVQPTEYTSSRDYNNIQWFSSLEMAKTYISGFEGSTGGALHIQPVLTRYKTSGSARHALFTIDLPEALNGLDDGTYDGITIRFKIDGGTKSAISGNPAYKVPANNTYYLILVDNDAVSTGHTERVAQSKVKDPYIEATIGTWVTWNITKEQLATYYTDGSTELSFVVHSETANNNTGYRVNTYLDYIEYYEAE
ncbi:MAG: hypothetical protein IJX03_08145 [Clostridia bacterium]|nr:hypothetical protein [Clostridia bacterium]